MHQTIVLTVGCFDLFHEGHKRFFALARKYGHELHVGVHDDASILVNKGRAPVESLVERKANIAPYCDAMFEVCEADPSEAIASHLSACGSAVVYVRADDWVQFPGRALLEARSIPIQFVPYTIGVSTTSLRAEMGL